MTALTPWQQPVWVSLRQRLAQGALPHAILLGGAAGLGKRAVAAQLAAAILCLDLREGEPCGRCRGCQLRAAGNHPDLHHITLVPNKQGNLRKEIVIEQVREMSRQLAMTSQLGGRQLALIDPADKLNRASANALLKTLEEPARDTVLVLVADQPWRLPATVRSRCQAFVVHKPDNASAIAWLEQHGVADAGAALAAAGGNPGLARRWQEDGSLDIRREVVADLVALAGQRASPAEIVARWDDVHADQRVEFAARVAADEMRARVDGNVPALGSAFGDLALLDWYRQVLRAGEDLRGPLRPSLVLFPLLAAWH